MFEAVYLYVKTCGNLTAMVPRMGQYRVMVREIPFDLQIFCRFLTPFACWLAVLKIEAIDIIVILAFAPNNGVIFAQQDIDLLNGGG